MFPDVRLRRNRTNSATRALLEETTLLPQDLIWPMFVADGLSQSEPIQSLPGISTHPISGIAKAAEPAIEKGIRAVLLFGKPASKDAQGSEADNEDGPVQNAVRNLKRQYGDDLVVITDVCMCAYTDHGHCGIVKDKTIDNDETIAALANIAVSHAQAGADWVAPSDMMDGRVGAIRDALDQHDLGETLLMSYAVKYASAFYGPFREAANSTPSFGDRRSYQMNPPNFREAMREAAFDTDEGADILMVKPAGPYLDIISQLRDDTDQPIAAYQVSGEYASICAAAEKEWLDFDTSIWEATIGIKRAGADLIISYAAPQLAAMAVKKYFG